MVVNCVQVRLSQHASHYEVTICSHYVFGSQSDTFASQGDPRAGCSSRTRGASCDFSHFDICDLGGRSGWMGPYLGARAVFC